MNQAVQGFLTKVLQDEELQAKMQAAENLDEAYAIASSVQSGFTKEEFVAEMEEFQNAIADDEELSEDDLKALAGGLDTTTGAAVGMTVTTAAAGAAAAGLS